jgi:non-homologous end joining protein Ku
MMETMRYPDEIRGMRDKELKLLEDEATLTEQEMALAST